MINVKTASLVSLLSYILNESSDYFLLDSQHNNIIIKAAHKKMKIKKIEKEMSNTTQLFIEI